MLTDAALRALKPKEKDFKIADRDGMYVHVTTKGSYVVSDGLSPERAARDPLPRQVRS